MSPRLKIFRVELELQDGERWVSLTARNISADCAKTALTKAEGLARREHRKGHVRASEVYLVAESYQ